MTCVLDTMDHSKFAFPKAEGLNSKSFSQFIRPCISCTGCIIHGHCALLVLTLPNSKHDSSLSADIVSFALHTIMPRVELKTADFWLHGDNATKELKNNCILQLLSALTSCHRLASAHVATLMSGHSHEDVDQWFSSIATWMAKQPYLETPEDMRQTLQTFLDQPHVRPHEPIKKVVWAHQARAWSFGCTLVSFLFVRQPLVFPRS